MRVKRFGVSTVAAFGAAAVLLGGAAPAVGQPGIDTPDPGTRPQGDAGDAPVTGPAAEDGPLAEEINELAVEVAQLGDERTSAREELDERLERLESAEAAWSEAIADLEDARAALEDAVGEAYAELSSRPENDLPDLTGLGPVGDEWDLPGLTSQLGEARTAESVAHASFDAAHLSAERSQTRYDLVDAEFQSSQDELDELIEENEEALEELERAREEAAAEFSDDFSSEVDGWEAAPEAKRAVEYALAQLGDPYVWGDEGPDTFDCSGLVMAAYDYAGVSLPRVAADQYNATSDKPVDTEHLLPGDLLYWWDIPGDWRSVYHTAIYIGDGKVVQAPRTGDVVKISSIWFEDFAGAHRVVDAVRTGPGDDDATGDPGGGGDVDEPVSPSPSEPDDGRTESPTPDPTPSRSPSPSPSPEPTDPTPTGGDVPDSPTPTVSDGVSGVFGRETETPGTLE